MKTCLQSAMWNWFIYRQRSSGLASSLSGDNRELPEAIKGVRSGFVPENHAIKIAVAATGRSLTWRCYLGSLDGHDKEVSTTDGFNCLVIPVARIDNIIGSRHGSPMIMVGIKTRSIAARRRAVAKINPEYSCTSRNCPGVQWTKMSK